MNTPSPAEQHEPLEPELLSLFHQTESHEPQDQEEFIQTVMQNVDRQYRKNIAWRVGLGLLVVLIAIPVQDLALAMAPLFVAQLIDIPNQLVAELLAPINSIGSVISLVLLGVRLTQKRLMDRLAMA